MVEPSVFILGIFVTAMVVVGLYFFAKILFFCIKWTMLFFGFILAIILILVSGAISASFKLIFK